jgi:hypothetical protein
MDELKYLYVSGLRVEQKSGKAKEQTLVEIIFHFLSFCISHINKQSIWWQRLYTKRQLWSRGGLELPCWVTFGYAR